MGGSDEDDKFGESRDQPLQKCTSPLRWVILVLACVMLIGSYYCYDIPAAIKTQLDDYMGNPSDYELKFGLLYTLYAAPNTILPFFGGYLVDRFGVRVCMLLFASTITVGQVIVSVGVSSKSWPVIFLGRFIFGLGGECFSVANSAFLADWFKGSELAFAFGVNLAVAKLGSVINNVVSPALVEDTGIIFAFWFGAILCGASVLCVLLAIPMDRNIEAKIAKGETKFISVSAHEDEGNNVPIAPGGKSINQSEEHGPVAVPDNATSFRDVFTLSHIFWVLVVSCMVVYGCVLPFNNISSSLLLERDYFIEPSSSCQLQYAGCQNVTNTPQHCPSSKWYQPPLPYNVEVDGKWYDQVTATDVDCTSDAWESGGCTSEYCSRLTDAESQASVIMSIPYIISACLSPPVGFLVDRYGMRAVIATLAPIMLVIVHLLLAITSVNAIGPLVGQGLAYTGFVSVLWPSVPLVVEDRLTGLGFGIVTSVQNLGVAVLPLVAASIYTDSGDKYIPNVEFLFVGLGAAGTLVGLYMNYYDYKNNSVLNRGFAAAEAARREEEGLLSYKNREPLLNPVSSNFNQRGSNDLSFDGAEDRFVESDLRNRSISKDGRTYSREARGPRGSSFTIYDEINKAGVYHH